MKTKFIVFAIATMGILLTGCNSDDDNNCPPDYAGELLPAEETLVGSWYLTAAVAGDEIDLTDDDTENPSTDLFEQVSACEKDRYYTFDDDRVMKFLMGTLATDCSNESESISSWKLEGNKLSFINTCYEFEVNLTFAGDDSAFSVEFEEVITDVEGMNISTTVTYIYTKEIR